MIKDNLKKLVGKGNLRLYHRTRNYLVALAAGFPSKKMTVIGITGTNGKTTVANLIASILEEAGFRVALATTIQYRINGHEIVNDDKMTVPDPLVFNRFLQKAAKSDCTHLILEATSIALDQGRLAGLRFDTGVLTNITHDHLDYHGTMDEYVRTKRSLFAAGLRASVLNADDPNGLAFFDLPADLHYLYSVKGVENRYLSIVDLIETISNSTFSVSLPDSEFKIQISTRLPGEFNRSNILAAIGVGLSFGINHEIIGRGIARVESISGRMERVESGQPFSVIVDYAHTPDALEKMYTALRPIVAGHNFISILGSCGDRDKSKRPVLGSLAGQNAKYVIITNEDPYTEDPEVIMDQVMSGIALGGSRHRPGETYWKIPDRKEAMRKAFRLAAPGDLVTITGKGAETAMVWGTKHVPWSDKIIALEVLAELGYKR